MPHAVFCILIPPHYLLFNTHTKTLLFTRNSNLTVCLVFYLTTLLICGIQHAVNVSKLKVETAVLWAR